MGNQAGELCSERDELLAPMLQLRGTAKRQLSPAL
jgi:hypothetical protein